MSFVVRAEQEIFDELAALCAHPGYIHAVAYFCFRDNVVRYAGEVTEKDLYNMFSPSRLIRTEITTLMGLMVKAQIDYALPTPEQLQRYITDTERLLEELHHGMSGAMFSRLTEASIADHSFDPFDSGEAMREPIFYGAESAYNFQYHDLAAKKYAADSVWLETHKGFSISEACAVASAVERVQAERLGSAMERLRKLHPNDWTMFPCFIFAAAEVAARAGLQVEKVERVLGAFTLPEAERNAGFKALQDFNVVSSTPLLRMPDGHFISLQSYGLAEALYEAPYYWMTQDRSYLPTLAENRGRFTEAFVAERLMRVFGAEQVHANVDIYESKATKVGEIDVLVIWGNRAIVVQAKSKRLTLEARKGNDQCIRDDFRKSVQDAYDQAVLCAQCLGDSRYVLMTPDGGSVVLPDRIKEIYILCVVCDHYPALSFQSRQFLKTVEVPPIQVPLVLDVFALDAITEMLNSPLRFFSYINRRANFSDRVLASQELTILGYHLKANLWIDAEVGLINLGDDFSAGLDIAMAVRRVGIPGPPTPDGILTRLASTTLGRIVKEIEEHPDPVTIDLGLMLLTLGEDAIKDGSKGIDVIAARARNDGKSHDITLGMGPASTGFTVHCNDDPPIIAGPRLQAHCERRKYTEKAKTWFGLCLSPKGPALRFGINLDFAWKQSDAMDAATRDLKPSASVAEALASLRRRAKVGRNEPCPCGSGLKYKKCCLPK